MFGRRRSCGRGCAWCGRGWAVGWRGLGETLHLEILRRCQEGGEVLLSNVDLSMIHEVEYRDEVTKLDTFQVQQRMIMFESMEEGSETQKIHAKWWSGRTQFPKIPHIAHNVNFLLKLTWRKGSKLPRWVYEPEFPPPRRRESHQRNPSPLLIPWKPHWCSARNRSIADKIYPPAPW